MEKFNIEIVETLRRIVTIEAKYPDDAIAEVKMQYAGENIVLDGNDYTDTEFNVEENEPPEAFETDFIVEYNN